MNEDHYFGDSKISAVRRISVPSTRQSSREDHPFTVDSLKLYESQIRAYYPNGRPPEPTLDEVGEVNFCSSSSSSSGATPLDSGSVSISDLGNISSAGSSINSTSYYSSAYENSSSNSNGQDSSNRSVNVVTHAFASDVEICPGSKPGLARRFQKTCSISDPSNAHRILPPTSPNSERNPVNMVCQRYVNECGKPSLPPGTDDISTTSFDADCDYSRAAYLNDSSFKTTLERSSTTGAILDTIVPFGCNSERLSHSMYASSGCSTILYGAEREGGAEADMSSGSLYLAPPSKGLLSQPLDSRTDGTTYFFNSGDSLLFDWLKVVREDCVPNVRTDLTYEDTGDNLRSLNECLLRHDCHLTITNNTPFSQIETNNHQNILAQVPIYVNLSRPVRVSFKSSLAPNMSGEVPTKDLQSSGKKKPWLENLSLFLPRSTKKILRLQQSTTAAEVIEDILESLLISDPASRFCLFVHAVTQSTKVTIRRIFPDMKLFPILLSWATPSEQSCQVYRLVLEDSETHGINWDEFTLPELENFLRILKREEEQYKQNIIFQYNIMRQKLLHELQKLQNE